jgi:hypothetical protein
MCFTLYIGASIKLPLIEWDKDQPAVNTTNLHDYELGVLSRFSFPYVLNIGSDQGCGCGFRQSHATGQEWLPIVGDNKDDQDAVQKNHVGLWQYLTNNAAGESIEIYACWNGDVYDCADCISNIRLEDILNDEFYFREGWLYKVTV